MVSVDVKYHVFFTAIASVLELDGFQDIYVSVSHLSLIPETNSKYTGHEAIAFLSQISFTSSDPKPARQCTAKISLLMRRVLQ